MSTREEAAEQGRFLKGSDYAQLQELHGYVAQMCRFLDPSCAAPDAWSLRDLIVKQKEALSLAQAEAAARLEALKRCWDVFGGTPHHVQDCPDDGACDWCATAALVERAVSSTAGVEVLERLKRIAEMQDVINLARTEMEAWKRHVDVYAAEADKAEAERDALKKRLEEAREVWNRAQGRDDRGVPVISVRGEDAFRMDRALSSKKDGG